jgi:hypothetical protein
MMNRREALKRTALLMGGALSSSAIAGILQGCKAQPELNWQPAFLTEDQARLTAEIAERILPKTDTPGAKEAGVPEFIDLMLNDIYTEEEKQRFAAGLAELEQDSEQEYGDSFLDLKPEQQDALLTKYEAQAKENQDPEAKPFFPMMKELTMLGFFTSEVGATQFLQYVSVPGRYEGCISIEEAGGRAFAT